VQATENYIVKHKAKDVDKIVMFVLKLSTLSSAKANNKVFCVLSGLSAVIISVS
jgi:hypothetical protein